MEYLPLEPKNPTQLQRNITQSHLDIYEKKLFDFWIAMRNLADNELSEQNILIENKPYPYGQCFYITNFVMEKIQRYISQKETIPNETIKNGIEILYNFLKAGGELRRIWGDLRGEYFQNALLVGSYYVDLSNDTVDISKPPLEVLPYEQAQIVAIKDFHHFAKLGTKYWNRTFYANTIFPELAPFSPLVSVDKNNTLKIEGNDYTIALALANGFALAQKALVEFPQLPKEIVVNGESNFAKAMKQINKLIGFSPQILEKTKQEAIERMKEINQQLNVKGEKKDEKKRI